MKKAIEFLEGIPMTVVSGIFLVISFILSKLVNEIPEFLDPAWISILISGLPILYSAVRKLICNKGISKISSALLISSAMIAAICIGDLFAAGEVAFIMAIGEMLEDLTTDRAKKGLQKLISLTPTVARRIIGDTEEIINANDVKSGDILRILPGETVAVDGKIISGDTSIDQSVITGESLPVDKTVGDDVFCGTINRFGSIDIKATRVGEDSSFQKLIRMVKDAENKKAPMQRIADKWASYLVPVALIIAVIAGLVKQNITVAVTVLVVFCPCALVLATPTAIMAAIGQATKHGVIIKSGDALEKMGKADVVALDKTGTLTYGRLEVTDVKTLTNGLTEENLISITASAESKSEHPIGRAIVDYAKQNKISFLDCESFAMTVGRGVFAKINGESVLCGNENYITENGIEIGKDGSNILKKLRNEGKATVIVATQNEVIGILALSDIIKENSADMINKLSGMNTETVLLTGDNKLAANYFADKIGIKNINAELLPEQKVSCITKLQNSGKTVCMIGDGVNDAPALKTADVGIAMGSMGSDIAVESADIALMGDDVSKIPYLKRLANSTLKTIKFGISLSLFINFAAIVLSFFELLNPTTGALVHNAGSVLVVFIAAMLYERKFDK